MNSELQITVAARNGGSYLQRCYFTRPFKVVNISEKGDEALHLALMSASPGMLDGDVYNITLNLEQGTNVHLYTQSYQRIFNMQQGARQQMKVQMAAGSSLYYLPHPSVPQEQSIFEGYNEICLESGCRLLWGEIVTCGRKLSGEVFRGKRFRNITAVYGGGRLLFRDVTLLEPQLIPAGVTGQWEGYTHQAALLWHDEAQDMNTAADEVHELLSAEKEIAAGVSQTAYGALLVRILGQGGEQLYGIFKNIARLAGADRKI